MDIKRRWKSLSLKVQHLRLELEDREDRVKELEDLFKDEVSKFELEDIDGYQNDDGIKSNVFIKGINEETESSNPPDGPATLKKIWRLIAISCHPDKTNNDLYKTELYKQAESAWRNGSYDELYRIAEELNIEIPEYTEESIEALSGISANLEGKIKENEQSIIWIWGQAHEDVRLEILDVYLRSIGKKRK